MLFRSHFAFQGASSQAEMGPPAVVQAIAGLAAGTLEGEVQDDSLATCSRNDWTR